MICPPCRKGGVMNQTGRGLMEHGEGYTVRVYSDPAELHAECEYPSTCPCQHRVGQYVAEAK